MTNRLRIFKELEIIDMLKEVEKRMHFVIQNILNGITNEILNKIIRDLSDIDMRVVLMTTITN